MPILSLLAKLGLDKSGFDAGMDSATKKANRFGSDLKTQLAGAFSVAAMASWVKSVANATGRIKDLSEQYRITTDEVQKADFALEQSGMQFEDLGQSLTKIGQARRDAVEGNMELRKTFERYGVALKDLNDPQLRNYDLLMKLSDAAAKGNITAREQVELADLLGAKATKLINVLSDLSTVKPPSLISKDDIDAIDRAEKAIAALKRTAQAETAPLMANTASTLSTLLKGAGGFLKGFANGEGIKGRLQGGMAGLDAGMMGGIREGLQPVAAAAAQAILEPIKEIINKVAGINPGAGGALFQLDKNVKADGVKSATVGSPFSIGDSGLGRIGAFTGAAALAAMPPGMREIVTEMKEVRMILGIKGAVIKDVRR